METLTTVPAGSRTGLTLYELAGADPELRFSPHCWKTRMALAHKGLEAERIPWRFSEPDRLEFSGQGRVPVLIDGSEVVSDSWQIALYLDERFPDRPPLFGGAGAVPLAEFVNRWSDGALLPVMVRIILLDIFQCLHDSDRDYFRTSREKMFGKSLEEAVEDQAGHLRNLKRVLLPLRQVLTGRDFLSGDAPAYADYCVFGMFMWARCTSGVELLEDGDPVFLWRERLLDAFGGLARKAPVGFRG